MYTSVISCGVSIDSTCAPMAADRRETAVGAVRISVICLAIVRFGMLITASTRSRSTTSERRRPASPLPLPTSPLPLPASGAVTLTTVTVRLMSLYPTPGKSAAKPNRACVTLKSSMVLTTINAVRRGESLYFQEPSADALELAAKEAAVLPEGADTRVEAMVAVEMVAAAGRAEVRQGRRWRREGRLRRRPGRQPQRRR